MLGMNGPSFQTSTPTTLAEKSSNDVSRASTAPPVQVPGSLWSSSSFAGPSTGSLVPFTGVAKTSRTLQNLLPEDENISMQAALRFTTYVAADHISTLYPDIDTPFSDAVDAVNRLLPYHVFQQPKEDLYSIGKAVKETGSRRNNDKETDNDIRKEIEETKFALKCFKRRKALQDRFRRIRTRPGKRTVPEDQAYLLEYSMLEADRSVAASLGVQLRNARMELERIERERRLASIPHRTTYYSHDSQNLAQMYRPYPYTPQSFNSPSQTDASLSTAGYAPSTPQPAPYVPSTPGAIPVQLPATSLDALTTLGIVPVPVGSLPPPDQPQPPAILKGATANGTMLSLEINVSLLQSVQMSGLAMMLNSLVRNGAGDSSNVNGTTMTPTNINPQLSVSDDRRQ